MMQFTLYASMLIMSMIFMQMNHPLAMGLMLLIQTFLVCLSSGLLAKSFWFSYVLFLIFLGGMLVLFIYVTSLASNEMFSLSMKLTMISASFFLLLLMSALMIDNMSTITYMNNETSLSSTISFSKENLLNLNKLYNYPTNFITLMMINYLLIALVAMVKITNVFYGPLRPMN
uniref:NADH dehydrogenase subunit 6 n=1 Tax=Apystomyia elinguis TaxID=797143 RepID=UPI0026E37E51|nr:NADH dehydrogenase subunit 6 [Apystomyia elinguis]WJW73499.1 NADH dehydrogenase subunit 6 [Apystomyia elinguis]